MKTCHVLVVLILLFPSGETVSSCNFCMDPMAVPSGYTVMTYNESLEHVENPHRGFLHQTGTHASSPVPLTMRQLNHFRDHSGLTMVRRNFVLDTFKDSPISDDFLQVIRHDLDVISSASFTVVLHFSYTDIKRDTPPYGDASKDVVLHHVQQLSPIFHEHQAVITVLEAGFIGTWGEWHSTDYFGNPQRHTPGHEPVTGLMPDALADRKDLLLALLHAAPQSIQVAVRYPAQKMYIMGDEPATFDAVQRGDDAARTANHNACFLANENDVGTYKDKVTEYPYLESDTRYTSMGGETCGVSQTDRHECPTALRELSMFHWVYLNEAYNKDVYSVWKQQGCYRQIHRRLGYRLVITKAILPDTVQAGDSMCVRLQFTNTGFHAPIKLLSLRLVLQAASGDHYAALVPGVDVRDWQPGQTQNVTTAVHVQREMPQGEYKVMIALSDRLLGNRADYNVLLASDGVPLYTQGLNDLQHTVTVSGHHQNDTGCPPLSPWQPPIRGHYSRVFSGSF